MEHKRFRYPCRWYRSMLLRSMGAVPGVLVLVLCGVSFLAGRYIQQAGELPSPGEVRIEVSR